MLRKYFSNLHVQSNESKKGSSLHFIKKNKLITHSALPSLHELLRLKGLSQSIQMNASFKTIEFIADPTKTRQKDKYITLLYSCIVQLKLRKTSISVMIFFFKMVLIKHYVDTFSVYMSYFKRWVCYLTTSQRETLSNGCLGESYQKRD